MKDTSGHKLITLMVTSGRSDVNLQHYCGDIRSTTGIYQITGLNYHVPRPPSEARLPYVSCFTLNFLKEEKCIQQLIVWMTQPRVDGSWPRFHVTNLLSSFSPGPSHASLSPPPLWFLNEALKNEQKQYIYHRGSIQRHINIGRYIYSVQPFWSFIILKQKVFTLLPKWPVFPGDPGLPSFPCQQQTNRTEECWTTSYMISLELF